MKVSEFISSRMEELIRKDEGSYTDYLSQVSEEVVEKFKTQCTFSYCGGFDSPVYDVDCYAVAFIEIDGKLNMMTYVEEKY